MSEDQHIDELFAKTLVGDYDDEEPWSAVHALRRIGSRGVFERAVQWCSSPEPLKRARGLDVLAQLGKTAAHSSNSFPEESFSVAQATAQQEREELPLRSAIFALGHLNDERAVPLILPFASHPVDEVRFAVAWALGNYPNDSRSAETLLHLMADDDQDVRDYATFGLGSCSDLDSPGIREALLQRVADSFADVRYEALVGLGKRRDVRVVPHVLRALHESPTNDWVIEAAYLMLGLPEAQKGWGPGDYADALRREYGAA